MLVINCFNVKYPVYFIFKGWIYKEQKILVFGYNTGPLVKRPLFQLAQYKSSNYLGALRRQPTKAHIFPLIMNLMQYYMNELVIFTS